MDWAGLRRWGFGAFLPIYLLACTRPFKQKPSEAPPSQPAKEAATLGENSMAGFNPPLARTPVQSAEVTALYDAYGSCVGEAVTNLAYGECGGPLIDGLEVLLAKRLEEARGLMPDEARAPFEAEQAAWVEYKEKSCLIYSAQAWGRIGQVLSWAGCRSEVLSSRIAWLEAFSKDERDR